MENSFYTKEELKKMGFKYLGEDVLISRKCSIYGIENISVNDRSRIDDFCILSGNIVIGKNVHVAAGCLLFAGDHQIVLKDFSGISSQTTVYGSSDDYMGENLTNPTTPDFLRKVTGGDVIVGKHAVIGTGSTILPNVQIGEGCSVGAKSLVNHSLKEWGIYFGIPVKYYKARSKKLLEKEDENTHFLKRGKIE